MNESLLELALAFLGRLVIRGLSFGRWANESWATRESSILAPAGALSYERDGQRVITFVGQQLAGLALLVALLMLCAYWA